MDQPQLPLDISEDKYVANIWAVAASELPNMKPEQLEDMMFLPPGQPHATTAIMLRTYRHIAEPMIRLSGSVMTSGGPFLLSEKFLLGAYASKLSGCVHCTAVQENAAITLGLNPKLLQQILYSVETAPIEPAFKPCFRFVQKIVTTPWVDLHPYRQAVLDAGWSKRALFDMVSIASLFAFTSRIFMGCGIAESLEQCRGLGKGLATKSYNLLLGFHQFETSLPKEADEKMTFRPPTDMGFEPINMEWAKLQEEQAAMRPGEAIELQNLTGHKAKYNGQIARVLEFVPHAGNWRCELYTAMVLRVQESNCKKLPPGVPHRLPPVPPPDDLLVAPVLSRPSLTDRTVYNTVPSTSFSGSTDMQAWDTAGGYKTHSPYPSSLSGMYDARGGKGSEDGMSGGGGASECITPSAEDRVTPGCASSSAGGSKAALAKDVREEAPTDCNAAAAEERGSSGARQSGTKRKREPPLVDIRRPTSARCDSGGVDRFCAVHNQLARDFVSDPGLVCATVTHDENGMEHIAFKVRGRWEKTRKALFAKQYTKMFKGRRGQRCHVVIYDRARDTEEHNGTERAGSKPAADSDTDD